jgi:diguanylate cyclase (GGDEF)-like protein/PAS domain S-box-containing protein
MERDALEGKVIERTRDLQESESNLRALVDFSPVAMVLTRTTDHTVVLANRRAAAMFEIPLDAIKGRSAPDYWVDPADRQRFLDRLSRDGRVDDLEAQLRTQSGRTFWARLSGQRLRFGGEDTLLGTIMDVTAQKQQQESLRELATLDGLTGSYNRRHVEEILGRELDRAERHGRPLTLAMMDVDHFKRINDTYGHQVGDEVLREISERCQRTIRLNDVFGRYGGEEFVVVFPEISLEDARVVAERLRATVAERPIVVGEHSLGVTVSIGLAAFAQGQDLRLLFQRADVALYAAKQGGRNLVRVWGTNGPPVATSAP